MAERLGTVLFVVLALLALAQPALAAPPIFVGNGTPASCTESALKDALIIAETVGGGTIRFHCGPNPVTIALSQVTTAPGFPVLLVLRNNTTIDGGGLITLDGTRTATVAFVDSDATVVLKHLSIGNGEGHDTGPGGIYNAGTLTLDHSTLSGNNISGLVFGGGIINAGTLTVDHSTISFNRAFAYCGGILTGGLGTLTVRNSLFEGNSTAYSGGAICGSPIIENSTFLRNDASQGAGAAIYGGGVITNSIFSENLAFAGGAIFSFGPLTIDKSTFSDNRGGGQLGGGIHHFAGTLTIRKSTFSGNSSFAGGGLFTRPDTSTSIIGSTFSENDGFDGGGIANFGTLTVDDSTFSGNFAGAGGGIFNGGTLAVNHSTITQNTASVGGGIYVCAEGQVPPFFNLPPCHPGTLSLTRTSVTENTPDDIFP